MMSFGFILQDQNSNMEKVLIRMVRKRPSMETGCNWLRNTSCLDARSLIITKLGLPTFPKRRAHFIERNHDEVGLQNVDEFRNSFLRKSFVPLIYRLP